VREYLKKILGFLAVSSLILGANFAQSEDLSGLFENTLVWHVTKPDGTHQMSTFLYNEDGTVTASQGDVTVPGTWAIKGDLNCVTVSEPDGTLEDLCTPTADLDGVRPGDTWKFLLQEKITITATLVAGR
jgi:hypothetical protein